MKQMKERGYELMDTHTEMKLVCPHLHHSSVAVLVVFSCFLVFLL